jgi:hypothetical protein
MTNAPYLNHEGDPMKKHIGIEVMETAAVGTAFRTASASHRGTVDVLTKNESRDALKSSIRAFVKAYLAYNPVVRDCSSCYYMRSGRFLVLTALSVPKLRRIISR